MRHYIVMMGLDEFGDLAEEIQMLVKSMVQFQYASEDAFAVKISETDLNSLKVKFPQFEPRSAVKRYHTALISEET